MTPPTATTHDYPAYLDALEIGTERSTRSKIEKLQAEIDVLTRALDDARRAKRILLVGGRDLHDELVRFLADEMGLRARAGDRDRGLFWLVDGGIADWCLGEVRDSESGNVTKEHLARVMIDRTDASRGDETPALLVVNTFATGTTMEERDQPVPADVAKRAAEDHIVVVRTLDLVRLRQRASNGFPAGEQLAEVVRSGGGWFEVDEGLNAGLHDGERRRSLQPSAR